MAHADDAEFLCAGTLARLRAKGFQIHIATMTAGDAGSKDLPPEEISHIRLGEAARSVALLEGTFHCAWQKELMITYDPPTLKKVTEIVRQVRPLIVFTHSPADYLIDHEMTSLLVRAATFAASVPNVRTGEDNAAAATDGIPYLYYADALEGKDIFGEPVNPGFYVDISDVIETKEGMLACHASQREWLLKQHGMDNYVNSMKEWSARRGEESGVQYAEAFRQHLGHAYPQDNKLAELLGIIENH